MRSRRFGKSLSVLLTTTLLMASCGSDEQAAPPSESDSSSTAASSDALASATDLQTTASPPVPQAGDLFTAPQPWTTDVSALPASERSEAIIAALSGLGGWGTNDRFTVDFSLPLFFANGSTPRLQVIGNDDYCFGGISCDAVPAEMPVPADAYIEGSTDLTCDITGDTEGQGDCHLLVVDRDEQQLYEVYQASSDGDAITAGAFFVWDLAAEYPPSLRGEQCTSADSAGFPIAPMLATADEVAAGQVNHALRFILPNDRIKEGVFVAPATHAGAPASTDPNAPPVGVRFRLNADFDESGYSEGEQVILRALKTYGMLLADGGQVPLTFAGDTTSAVKWSDLGVDSQSFSGIAVDQFDVVDLGLEIELTYNCVLN
ncbi:MAG: hypothetical protein ACSLE6_12315 [Mycobacterium sp.]